MPSQRTFDGPDLETALTRIRAELGDEARILGAERVRRGGLAGFFARERYEVMVELDDEGHLLDIPPAAPADSILELAERVNRSEQAAVSTQTPSFAAVLEGITTACGLGPTAPDGARPADEGSGSTDDTSATEPADDGFVTGCPPPGSSGPADRPSPPAAPSVRRGHWVGVAAAEPAGPGGGSTRLAVREEATQPSLGARLVALGVPELLLTQLPTGPAGGDDMLAALLSVLGRLPGPPPLPASPGAVTAVVGERRQALDLARDLAHDLGVDPGAVVLASQGDRGGAVAARHHLADAASAGDARRSWRRRPHVTVVAVDASHRRQDCSWARHVLAAVEPAATWGVVDAGRKTDDLTAWAEALGGLEALALHGVEETTTPAAALTIGIPVARLDGRRASAARWAAILSERLT